MKRNIRIIGRCSIFLLVVAVGCMLVYDNIRINNIHEIVIEEQTQKDYEKLMRKIIGKQNRIFLQEAINIQRYFEECGEKEALVIARNIDGLRKTINNYSSDMSIYWYARQAFILYISEYTHIHQREKEAETKLAEVVDLKRIKEAYSMIPKYDDFKSNRR